MNEFDKPSVEELSERESWPRDPAAVEAVSPTAPTERAIPALPALTLTAGQNDALAAALRVKESPGTVAVIAGYAGTGKTTMLRVIAEQAGGVVVVTPTGKAALRVTEATNLPAQTIHRWIYKPTEDPKTGAIKFVKRELGDIDVPRSGLVLLDEASMVGPDVWQDVSYVCKALGLSLVCVGDGFQLPPVQGPNEKPFSLMLPAFAASVRAERVELTEVLRQAQDSPVVRASMRLRQGEGIGALAELPRVSAVDLTHIAVETYKANGVVICHRNVTRHALNARLRQALGIYTEDPQPGEPLLVLKNNYEVGLFNGESVRFGGWTRPPAEPERIFDRYKKQEEWARFGTARLGMPALVADDYVEAARCGVLALEEIHGRLQGGVGAIASASRHWAKVNNQSLNDDLVPHLHANFGYVYTCHKSQGSQWPYALVVLESSVRLNEEEGRRWVYTAVTRSQQMAAIHAGNPR